MRLLFSLRFRSICSVLASALCLGPGLVEAFSLGAGARAVLQGRDVLTLPGKEVDLVALLMHKGGNGFPYPLANKVVQFALAGDRLGTARTSSSGVAVLRTRFERPGDYTVRLSLRRRGMFRTVAYEIRVRVAPPRTNFLVIDIENTLHGFSPMRFPYAKEKELRPLPGAVKTLQRLSRKFSLFYLSSIDLSAMHKLRAWMDGNGFPMGPVLFWDLQKEAGNIERQKVARLKKIRVDFLNILGGIGHPRSDAAAFQENRMGSYLVNANSVKDLPTGAHRFNNWAELDQFLFPGRKPR